MKAITPVVLAGLLWAAPLFLYAQVYRNEKIAYLDADGRPSKEKKAAYLQQVIQFNDTLWEHNFYVFRGHKLSSVRCRDAAGNVLNGRYATYSVFGTLDTLGEYANGKRNGEWSIYTTFGRLLARQFYQNGVLQWTKDSLQVRHEQDSAKAARELVKKDSARFVTTVHLDSITKIEVESDFPGGPRGWLNFMNKNLRYPGDAVNRNVQGQVVVDFVVDKEGHIAESTVWVSRSIEFALDQEAIRLILHSPDWTPASQNGRPVKSYKRQPVNFRLEVR
jgi:protein TonB